MGRLLFSVAAAYACPYEAATTDAKPLAAAADGAAAAHAARSAELLGSGCATATGLMARRVIETGENWAWTGGLKPVRGVQASQVAAPFAVPAADDPHLIANELLETLVTAGHAAANLSLVGKSLEVDGVLYVVVTSYQVLNS